MSSIYRNWKKTIKQIKNTIFYVGVTMAISSIFYYIALGINNLSKYLLKSMGFKPKTITYPRKKKDEDILGI